VIETRSHQASKTRNANDEKSFIVMARLAATLQIAAPEELLAAAVKVCLQEVRRGQQAGGDHQAKRWDCQRPKVEKRDHRRVELGSPVSIPNGLLSLECHAHL